MDRLLFLLFALVLSNAGYSQLNVIKTAPAEEIGKVKNLFDTSLEATKRGDVYTILYQDIEYQQIKEFKSFSMNEQSFNELYDLILQNWDNPPKEDIMIDLPGDEGILWLAFVRMLGTTNIQFVHAPYDDANVFGRSQYLTKKKVDKLFGK